MVAAAARLAGLRCWGRCCWLALAVAACQAGRGGEPGPALATAQSVLTAAVLLQLAPRASARRLTLSAMEAAAEDPQAGVDPLRPAADYVTPDENDERARTGCAAGSHPPQSSPGPYGS